MTPGSLRSLFRAVCRESFDPASFPDYTIFRIRVWRQGGSRKPLPKRKLEGSYRTSGGPPRGRRTSGLWYTKSRSAKWPRSMQPAELSLYAIKKNGVNSMWHREVITEAIEQTLKDLQHVSAIQNFYLAGVAGLVLRRPPAIESTLISQPRTFRSGSNSRADWSNSWRGSRRSTRRQITVWCTF